MVLKCVEQLLSTLVQRTSFHMAPTLIGRAVCMPNLFGGVAVSPKWLEKALENVAYPLICESAYCFDTEPVENQWIFLAPQEGNVSLAALQTELVLKKNHWNSSNAWNTLAKLIRLDDFLILVQIGSVEHPRPSWKHSYANKKRVGTHTLIRNSSGKSSNRFSNRGWSWFFGEHQGSRLISAQLRLRLEMTPRLQHWSDLSRSE